MKTIKDRMIKQRNNINPNIKKHYTPEDIVKLCLSKLNLTNESVLDVGAGLNMVWYNNLICKKKDWVEIDKGRDLLDYNKHVDWCIGNPPYKDFWKYMSKCLNISNKGIAFLVAVDFWNRLTQKRLQEMFDKGFNIHKIYVTEIKVWFGRYFFIIFKKQQNKIIDTLAGKKLTGAK